MSASVWASSHSWWGKIRSSPPPWMSNDSTGAPRAVPGRLARLGRIPQSEVTRVPLAIVHLDAGAGLQLVEVLARELAVGREPPDLEVDVAVHHVGVAAGDEPLDEPDHLRQVLGRLGLDVRRLHAERGHVLVEGPDVALGHLASGDALLDGAPDDLVVDVREVAHECDAVAGKAQVAGDHVEDHQHPRVTDVREVVHRHPARVHLDLAGRQRDEILLHARHRVVDFHSPRKGAPPPVRTSPPGLRRPGRRSKRHVIRAPPHSRPPWRRFLRGARADPDPRGSSL